MRHQLPTSATVHIDPQVPRVLHRLRIAPYPRNFSIGPSHGSSASGYADIVLFTLEQLERRFALRHIRKECRLRARSAVRFYVCAMLVDNLIEHVDIRGDQGIKATLLN